MGTLILEGETLGQKHRHYNKLVKEMTSTNSSQHINKINYNEPDIDNLIKVDMASSKKDVDYILEVFKCEDMLYVSRAIKKSVWLITEAKFAYIINPDYLHTQLLPQMTSKAGHKLLLTIRLNLKDEKRVELFFKYYEEKTELKNALKWLPNCSISYIESIVKKYGSDIPIDLMKRLCEKSITILEIFAANNVYETRNLLSKTTFLLKTNGDSYIRVLNKQDSFRLPTLNAKSTKIIMKNKPDIILDNFKKFARVIDIPTFVKFLKKEHIKEFLLKLFENEDLNSWFGPQAIEHFIVRMSSECRFEFVKSIFIEKTHDSLKRVCEPKRYLPYKRKLYYASQKPRQTSNENIYRWYKFAPFSIAFADLKKLLRIESNPRERNQIFSVLISCARRHSQYLQTILQYYRDHHLNEPFIFKIYFVNIVLSQSNSHRFDDKTLSILNDIFYSMEVYSENENSVQTCVKHIIVYKIVHDEPVPEVIENKFMHETLKSFQTKLNDKEKDKIFNYLYQLITKKIQSTMIKSESNLKTIISLIISVLNLLRDWNKNLLDHEDVLEKIKECIKIKYMNFWNNDLSEIYNVKKSWRKHMFNESLYLHYTNETFINALKHGPELLLNWLSNENICLDDSINITRFLNKLRSYWPQTLAKLFEQSFRKQLINKTKHGISIRGLCVLLPQKHLADLLSKYKPKVTKIDWTATDDLTLSIQKSLAKYVHLARPHPSVDAVIWYAKGDYLQFVLQSLYSILSNKSSAQSIIHIQTLLDSPVSFQKHSIKFAFVKLNLDDLLTLCLNTWNTTKNASIRATIFKHLFELLCKEKDEKAMREIWNVLDTFTDKLTTEENKIIYVTLSKANKVPTPVKQTYCIKSYKFLKSLPPKINSDNMFSKSVINSTLDIMEFIDIDFIAETIFEYFDNTEYLFTKVISSCLLSTKSEAVQTERYEKVFVPLLKKCLAMKDANKSQINYNFYEVLERLLEDLEQVVINKNMITPIKLFKDIYCDLKKNLSNEDNYVLLTTWNLAAKYMLIMEKYRVKVTESQYNNDNHWKSNVMHFEAAPEFGNVCMELLKEDTKRYFPSIYILFSKALHKIFQDFNFSDNTLLATLKSMQKHADNVERHLLVLNLLPHPVNDADKDERSKIWEVLDRHPSAEVRMPYQQMLQEVRR